jgi:hypothetical protein
MSVENSELTVVSTDLACVGCGYNLRTQPLEGACPECAMPVTESLEIARQNEARFGQAISTESWRWLIVGALGCFGYLIGVLIEFPASVSGTLTYLTTVPFTLCVAGANVMYWVSWWAISRCGRDRRRFSRLTSVLSRTLFAGSAAATIQNVVVGVALGWQHPYQRAIIIVLYLVNAIATVIGFAWLAVVAGRMRRGHLRFVCIVVSLLSLDQVRSAITIFGWEDALGGALVAPRTPLIGDLTTLSLRLPFYRWPVLVPLVWLIVTAGILFYFSVLLLRLSAEVRGRGDV